MNAIEHLQTQVWKHPSSYFGFSPDGDYLVCARHRESDTIARSNYACAFRDLRKLCEGLPDAPEEPIHGEFPSRGGLSPRSSGWVYDFRASCSLVGWIEYLLVRKDAPDSVLEAAGEIVCAIADYPILDEDHHSEMEMNEIEGFWAGESVAFRIDAIQRSGSRASVFAARRNYTPDDNGAVWNYLRD